MVYNWEKFQFLHHEKDVWDRLAEEMQLSEGLATQLVAVRQEVAELAPATQELADLGVREKDAHDDAPVARKMLMALIKRARTDAMEAEQLWKERDDML